MNSDSYETPHRSLLEYEGSTVNESLRVSRVHPSPSSGNDMKVIRDLSRIRRRRSDPATKRWREQYSKIYKEQIPNEFREHPFPVFPAIARKSRIYSQVTCQETEAAKKIQRQARRFLRGRMKTSRENSSSVLRHDGHDALIIERALTM